MSISGGSFAAGSNRAEAASCIRNSMRTSYKSTISGGTFESTDTDGCGINYSSPLEISGSTSVNAVNHGIYVYNDAGEEMKISGGKITASSGSALYKKGTGTVAISGGTLKGSSRDAFAVTSAGAGEINITGGTIRSDGGAMKLSNGTTNISGGDTTITSLELCVQMDSGANTISANLFGKKIHSSPDARLYVMSSPNAVINASTYGNCALLADSSTKSFAAWTSDSEFKTISSSVNGAVISALGTDTYLKTGDSTIITLAAGSHGTAGDKKITGLTSGKKYKITIGAVTYYAKADGTLSPVSSDAAALTGTELKGLTNGTAYKVEVVAEGGGSYTPTNSASVVVDGNTQTAGTVETTTQSGKTTTTVAISTDKLKSILESTANGTTVTIPITTGADTASGRLDGQAVKAMEAKDATLVIKTESASYTLPASEIKIDSVSEKLGEKVSLGDITVNVTISKPSDTTAKIVESASKNGGYSLVAPAVEFKVSCTYGGRTVEVSTFNSYVERLVAIPNGVDPSKITTGVVVDPDGTTHHVPTEIIIVEGKYYAKINSLTNSVYSVIYNPVKFSDLENHWAKTSVNNMGSRLVVNGVGNNKYEPDRSITRAEFAAVMVKALGLEPGTGTNGFDDVPASAWYCGYVATASSYGVIKGYNSKAFGPSDSITREQAMTMIARAMKITGLKLSLTESQISELLAGYADGANASSYAKESIAACLKAGIISGTSEKTLSPKDSVTRAEVAVMAERLLEKSKLI